MVDFKKVGGAVHGAKDVEVWGVEGGANAHVGGGGDALLAGRQEDDVQRLPGPGSRSTRARDLL